MSKTRIIIIGDKLDKDEIFKNYQIIHIPHSDQQFLNKLHPYDRIKEVIINSKKEDYQCVLIVNQKPHLVQRSTSCLTLNNLSSEERL